MANSNPAGLETLMTKCLAPGNILTLPKKHHRQIQGRRGFQNLKFLRVSMKLDLIPEE